MAAERKFGVDRKRIREWIQNESKIQAEVSSDYRGSFAKELDGDGKKIKDKDLEEMLFEWINLQRSNNLRVSQKLIQRKARIYAEEKPASKGQMNDFCAGEGWLENFMSRNGLLLLCRATQVQKTPEQITDEVILYILYVRQLKQRNNEMISNTTVADKGVCCAENVRP